jgi:hypothetical protein
LIIIIIIESLQVMRDYKRPDRVAMREMMQQNGATRKRSRSQEPSTPLLDTVSFLFGNLLSLFLLHLRDISKLTLQVLCDLIFSLSQLNRWHPLLKILSVYMITMYYQVVEPS